MTAIRRFVVFFFLLLAPIPAHAIDIQSVTSPGGVTVEKMEQAIDAEIAAVLKDGVTDQEVADAKKRMEIAAVKSRDSLSGAAQLVATRIATGSSLADIQAWPDRIAKITAADVLAAAKLVLVPNNSATGTLLPKPGANPGAPPATPPAAIGGGIQ